MPFAVINADDYYGRSAFQLLHNWLIEEHKPNEFSIAGFILKNTLSDNGAVTRGICKVNSEMMLTDIDETHDIIKTVGEKTERSARRQTADRSTRIPMYP